MKKGEAFTLATIIKGIIVFFVIVSGWRIMADLSSTPVQYLLGNANISQFDQEMQERFNLTQQMNQNAVNSVNGLIFAVNSLAYIDTYKEEKDKVLGLFDPNVFKTPAERKKLQEPYMRSFGSVDIKPTYYDRETVFVSPSATYDEGLRELAIGTINCWLIFHDKDTENTNCYSIVFEDGYKHLPAIDKLSEKDFLSYLEKEKWNICYYLSERFKHIPKDTCANEVEDITGGSWYSIFNSENLNWEKLPDDYFTSREGQQVSICANNDGLNEVFFHADSLGNACEADTNRLSFGYKVNNFALPQEFAERSGVGGAIGYLSEEWLAAYGDPNYILFYEKFPQEEATYWEMDSYQVGFAAIIGTEIAISTLSVITMGLGRIAAPVIRPLVGVVKVGGKLVGGTVKLAGKIVPFKQQMRAAVGAVGDVFLTAIKNSARFILRRGVAADTIEEAGEIIIKETLRKRLGKEAVEELGEDSILLMKKKAAEAFGSLGDDAFDSAGRITTQGREAFGGEFSRVMQGTFKDSAEDRLIMNALKRDIPNFDSVIRDLGTTMGKEMYDATWKLLARAALNTQRTANRANNMLKHAALDMSEAERKGFLIGILRDSETMLTKMSPNELRIFLANQRKAQKLILNQETGEFILGQTGREFTDEAKKQALRELKNFVTSTDVRALVSRTERMYLSVASRGLDMTNPLMKKRHLLAMAVGVIATRLESMEAKYYPIGTNAMGLKTPYLHTATYGEFNFLDVSYSDINNFTDGIASTDQTKKVESHKELAKQFLEDYGEPGLQGMLPETNRYYLSLTKDKGWFDQDPQRFHLVSPCQTDILLEVSSCECYYDENEESGVYKTGKKYEIKDGEGKPTGIFLDYDHFDGDSTMLYSIDNEHNAIKECHPKSFVETVSFANPIYTPLCIQINPQVENFGEDNYCYHGISDFDTTFKAVVSITEVLAPFACVVFVAAPPLIPVCMAGVGMATGVSGEVLKEAAIDIPSQWPSHD
ncbi:hypothetical protein GOV09_02495 [Candidatus Woesearchaeota archaeon]|nr:hypothetical protein [Candidatus Woesearchaeota archaeon]